MATELKMPALSPTMEEGTLAKWLVKEGDEVKSGDILAEIETDKATMEFEAVDEGKIAKILVPEGTDGVKVGTADRAAGCRWRDASAMRRPRRPQPEPKPATAEEPAPAPESQQAERRRRMSSRLPPATWSPTSRRPSTSRKSRRARRWSARPSAKRLRDAMAEEMRKDDRVFVMGEEVARVPGRLQGHAGPARRSSVRSASSTRRSPNMALPASARARRWAA